MYVCTSEETFSRVSIVETVWNVRAVTGKKSPVVNYALGPYRSL